MNNNFIFGGIFAFSILLLGIVFLVLVINIVGRWCLFKKAGKNGWEAIIPFYSDWVYVEIAQLNYWWFFLVVSNSIANFLSDDLGSIFYFVSLIALFVCNYNISKKLHKDTVFAVLMTIFPFIFVTMAGVSSNYKWDDSVKVGKNGPFGNNETDDNFASTSDNDNINNSDVKYCPYCGKQNNNNDKFCSNCGREI